jgi:hypothetical protein
MLRRGSRGALVRLTTFAALAGAVAVPGLRRSARQAWSVAAVVLPAFHHDADLDRALSAGADRPITPAFPPAATSWTDLTGAAPGNPELIASPVSLCWRGSTLAVADARDQRVVVFDSLGGVLRTIGGRGVEPGRFTTLSRVRCGPGPAAFLAVDGGPHRVSIFGADGAVRASLPAPPTPQLNLYPGDFALLASGRWFDSWLGATHSTGPYLSEREWRDVRLVRAWNPDGSAHGAFGDPVPYANTVARRVLNRVALDAHRDTLWTLTQGDAVIRGFDAEGRAAGPRVLLPIYYRGREPYVLLDPAQPAARDGWRSNSLVYEPNVQSLAVVGDSLFATIRYRDWSLGLVGSAGSRYMGYRARSAVEVIDRRGRVLGSFAIPGFARELASDGGDRLAVLTEAEDGRFRVLVAAPGLVSPAPLQSAAACTASCFTAGSNEHR